MNAYSFGMSFVNVLTNPYFLGYVVVVLFAVKFGNWLRHQHEENVARRKERGQQQVS